MSARAEAAVQALYEDADLRDELTDEEAQPLYHWAEAQIAQLDASAADDAAFETSADALRRLLKTVNRFVGRRGYATPEEQAEVFAKIAEPAQALGFSMPPEQPATFVQAQAAVDNQTALKTLLDQLSGGAAAAPAEAAPAPESAPAEPSPAQQFGEWLWSHISTPQTTIESGDNPDNPSSVEPSHDEPSPNHDSSSGEPF